MREVDELAAWDDETRQEFDQKYLAPIERAFASYIESLEMLQEEILRVEMFLDSFQ